MIEPFQYGQSAANLRCHTGQQPERRDQTISAQYQTTSAQDQNRLPPRTPFQPEGAQPPAYNSIYQVETAPYTANATAMGPKLNEIKPRIPNSMAPPPIPMRQKDIENQYNSNKDQYAATIRNKVSQESSSFPSTAMSKTTNHARVKEQTINDRSSQSPSPTVNQNAPYVGANKQTFEPLGTLPTSSSSQTFIDLDKDMTKIKSAMKSRSEKDFVNFNRELMKGKTLGDIRKSLVNNPYLSDSRFIVGDENQIFYGHKTFLVSASCLFLENFHTNDALAMYVENVDPAIFLEILTYCYTEKINIHKDNVLDILQAANKLEVKQITNVCHQYINNMFSPEMIFKIFEKSIEMKSELFQKKCMDFITKNEQKCFSSKGFHQIPLSSLIKILELFKFPPAKNSEIIEKWTSGEHGESGIKAAEKLEVPSLMSLNVNYLPPLIYSQPQMANLINFDDENGATSGLIIKDDEDQPKKFSIIGARHKWLTEFSRIDFTCKRSMLIHDVWFTENLATSCKEIKLSISLFEGNKRTDIHHRTIRNDKPGKFSR